MVFVERGWENVGKLEETVSLRGGFRSLTVRAAFRCVVLCHNVPCYVTACHVASHM